ncbi:RNA-dependent RNA polymerase 2 [Bienertia sinuspersici]
MAIDRRTVERSTVKVSNIPLTATAQDILAFLESKIGKGSIFAIEIFTEKKNWKSKGFGRVQFETLEAKCRAQQLGLENNLLFKGCPLSLSNSHEDVVVRPIEPNCRGVRGDLYVGLMKKEDEMCVIDTLEDVKFWVMPDRSCVVFHVDFDGEFYKLEVQFDDIFEAFGCYFDENSPAILLKVKYAPKIYKKISGPNLYTRFSADRYHICKEDLEFIWVRTTEISNRNTFGLSSALCWEVEEGSMGLEFFSTIPFYKKTLKNLILEEYEDYSFVSGLVPLVKCENILKLDYEILFQINSLVHTLKISLADVTAELIDYLSTLSVDKAHIVLQKVHKLSSTCYEPLSFIKTQVQALENAQNNSLFAGSRLKNDKVMRCHRALVTPTKICLLGPELESSNYIVKNFAAHTADFMRVTFVDEDWGKLHPMAVSVSTEQGIFSKPFRTSIYHRVLSILREGIVVGNKRFEFLAFSASQLRSNSVWMFASNDKVTAGDIREWMGSFNKIRSVSKCAARMGQLFSAAWQTLVVPVQDVEVIPDIEKNSDGIDYCFSDGIGKISLSFARQVAQKCEVDQTPSAFQIRYGGYKGVVAVDRNSFRKLSLRSSMLKFESKNRMLNVTKCNKSQSCYLNREIVTLLTTLGVEDDNLEALLQEHMRLLGSMLTSRDAALAVLESTDMGESKTLVKMLRHGFEPNEEPYLLMMLRAYLESQLSDLRGRCRIYVPKGRVLLGCLDETGILDYGQVFVRLTLRKTELDNLDLNVFQKLDEKTAILKGKVVVTKNPCLHPGDVRVLEAVYEVALEEKGLIDCLIFPQKGERPHPNECSGGDLDGDLYFISWDEKIIPPKTVAPMDYTACRPRIMDHDVTMEEIQRFFVDYMISDTLGTISTAHLVLADREPEKALSPKCLRLAELHSMAVDFAKTGAPAEMPNVLKPKEYPDFMERWDRPTYKSKGILGKLYRATVAATIPKLDFSWSEETARAAYDPELEEPGFEAFIETAKACKEMYRDKMSVLLMFYGATTEDEILTGNLRSKSAYLQRDNRRYRELTDRILVSVKSLRNEAKGWFQSSCKAEDRQMMASAWYHVTYHPSHCHDSANCLGFPWTVSDVLLTIKSANRKQS